MATPEGKIKRKICDYLATRADVIFFWTQATTGTFNPMLGTFRRMNGKYQKKGISDILGFMQDGRFFALEVKSKTGRATKEQLEFLDVVKKLGHASGIVRSIEDTQEVLSGKIGISGH